MDIKINHDFPILIIAIEKNVITSDPDFDKIKNELEFHNHHFIYVFSNEKAVEIIKRETGIGGIIISRRDSISEDEFISLTRKLVEVVRSKNSTIPIFVSSKKSLLKMLPLDIVKEIHECININEDTPRFIAGRINLAMRQYIDGLLPPYFSALKEYAQNSPYYWDCPGHQGGVAYLKHPVGREFVNFFGENMMRADIGISTPKMGDWLEHKGVPAESEKRAAKLFGADKTFYVTGGSSQANQIVGHSFDLKDKFALVDRNCHKSVNHELTITQAKPVYFQPSRNGYGIIGLIHPKQFEGKAIYKKIHESLLSNDAQDKMPVYAIITNCTYDGLIYDVTSLTKTLSKSVARIKFDEAWYAYAKFHPLYQGRFAMGIPEDKNNGPTLYAVQSTHKMLAALSSASMIHIRSSARAPVDYDVFNQAFMMHGTTSPFYPIIASIDVATSMMEGKAGHTFVDDAIHDAICFRKTLVTISNTLKASNPKSWFFDIWQPKSVVYDGITTPFSDVPDDALASEASFWHLKANDCWHGFGSLPEGYAMLDPIKVTITCPGLNAQGEMSDFGIPAPVVSKYLDTQRIIPARTGDYTILVLFALGSTQGKWNTLIDMLMTFKSHYDLNTPLNDVLPALAAISNQYRKMGLADLCQAIHLANVELHIAKLSERACAAEAIPVLTPSEAYACLVADKTELVKVSDIRNRTLAVMITPYPPGIPLIMPGEKVITESQVIIDYLLALQMFGQRFPGFEHELQGVEIDDDGVHWVRCIKETPLRKKAINTESLAIYLQS